METLFIPAALAAGALLAVQAGADAQLSRAVVFTAIPVIGTAAAVGLTVAGQQVASVLVDRYGWFRLPQRPVSGVRLAGVALLLAGVAAMKLL